MFIGWILALLGMSDVEPHRLENLLEPAEPIEYLIVSGDALVRPASRLAQHREATGLPSSYVTRRQIETVFGEGPQGLWRFLRLARQRWPGELRYVLLLGDTPAGLEEGVPTFRLPGTSAWPGPVASDQPYASPSGSGRPELAVGRLPVSSRAEAERLVERIIAYDLDREPGAWRHRIALFGERGGFGTRADAIVENGVRIAMDLLVPHTFQIEATLELPGSPFNPHPKDFHEAVLETINRGALATIYAGHGSSGGLGSLWTQDERLPIFSSEQASGLEITGGGNVFFLFACSTGSFDEVGASFAERLLLSQGGPVAVVAASHLSHPFGDIQLGRGICNEASRGARRLGDLFLAGQRAVAEPDWFAGLVELAGEASGEMTRREMQEIPGYTLRIYHLLGDPGMRFGAPERRVRLVSRLEARQLRVHGEVPGWREGKVRLSVHRWRGERPRDAGTVSLAAGGSIGRAERLDLWRRANDTEVLSRTVALDEGRFASELDLSEEVSPGRYLLHAYAENGRSDAVGASECVVGEGAASRSRVSPVPEDESR